MKVRRSLLKDQVTVETFASSSGVGPVYSTATTVAVHAEPTRRLVRGPDGVERISELTLTVHPDDAARFTPQSRVTYSGRVSEVITNLVSSYRGYPVEAKVTLT